MLLLYTHRLLLEASTWITVTSLTKILKAWLFSKVLFEMPTLKTQIYSVPLSSSKQLKTFYDHHLIFFICSATLDGSDFEGADLTLANVELAQVSVNLV